MEPLYTSLQTRQGVDVAIRFPISKKKRYQYKVVMQGQQPVSLKTSTMLPLFNEDKYRLNVFISLAVFLSFRGFAL